MAKKKMKEEGKAHERKESKSFDKKEESMGPMHDMMEKGKKMMKKMYKK